MKRILLLLLTLIIAAAMLFSCDGGNGEDKPPEGLELTRVISAGGIDLYAAEGFKFYTPEGWSTAAVKYDDDTTVYTAKITNTSRTSITLVKADAPSTDIADYFTESMEKFPSEYTVTSEIAPSEFGKAGSGADSAYKVIYTYKYNIFDYSKGENSDIDFTCMQIFLYHGEDFYIFTYTAKGTPTNEGDDYQRYLEKVSLAASSFEFVEKSGESTDNAVYEKDEDGYNLVSDKKYAGFSLYLPDSYSVIDSSAYVSAKISDKANISLSKATDTGVDITEYWATRKGDLEKIYTDVTEIAVNVKNADEPEKPIVLGDLAKNNLRSFEYTYKYNEKTYHVLQIMGVQPSFLSGYGYVFTYTAEESEYESHMEEIDTILEKVIFS